MAIVYIESNTTGFGQSLLDASLNHDETCFLVRDRARYPFLARLSPAVRVIDCDTQSVDALERVVGEIPDVRYIASTSDAFIENAARLSQRLGLPGTPAEAVALCRDKLRLQDTLRDHGVPYPYTTAIESADAARKLTYPVIVKPRQGTGSIGVRLVEREQDFPDTSGGAFICQRFIPGAEFSVESFSDADGHHVLAVTRKFLTKPPHFLELAHVLPADLDAMTQARIVDTVRRALDAVGYAFGPAHTELKVHGDTITIIEINARLAGGMIPRLMERAYGWSIADLYVRSHLSRRSQFVVPTPALYSAVAFVVPEVGRRYVGIDFPDDCADAGLFSDEGVNAGKFDFSDRAGYVISFGRSASSVLRKALSLRMRSRVLYDDPERTIPGRDAIHDIVYESSPPCFGKLTVNLLAIEKAHLIMLREQGILSAEQFRSLREAVTTLEANPALLSEHVSGRGDYFDYEQYVIDRCGRDTGGMIQAARSRNDINATHLLLTVRQALSHVTRRVVDLGETLARRAADSAEVLLPIYSQYQTAMPGVGGPLSRRAVRDIARHARCAGVAARRSWLFCARRVRRCGHHVRHRPAAHGGPAGLLDGAAQLAERDHRQESGAALRLPADRVEQQSEPYRDGSSALVDARNRDRHAARRHVRRVVQHAAKTQSVSARMAAPRPRSHRRTLRHGALFAIASADRQLVSGKSHCGGNRQRDEWTRHRHAERAHLFDRRHPLRLQRRAPRDRHGQRRRNARCGIAGAATHGIVQGRSRGGRSRTVEPARCRAGCRSGSARLRRGRVARASP
ncbi:ATP-grasp domain-containing protein [Burkholderia vietnamiensis]|nr:ATP-grasp domain-containing protein [Burkholderia vietnamiensis]